MSIGIAGITHNEEGDPNIVEQFHRKVSVGYSPFEKPWNSGNNYPQAAGYFRIMELVLKKVKTKDGIQNIPTWVLSKPDQKLLELANGKKDKNGNVVPNEKPTILPIMCLDSNPDNFIDAKMAKWNATNNLECSSKGDGKPYSMIEYDEEGEINYTNIGQLDVDGKAMEVCDINRCKHRKKKSCTCKPSISLKIFPKLKGLEPNILEPWKIGSSSVNTVVRINSSIEKIRRLMLLSYEAENSGPLTEEQKSKKEWFFGKVIALSHKQITSGTNKVWITEIVPSKNLRDELMAPILKAVKIADDKSKKRCALIYKEINSPVQLEDNSKDALAIESQKLLDKASKDEIVEIDVVEIKELDDEVSGDEKPDVDSNPNKKDAKDKLISIG